MRLVAGLMAVLLALFVGYWFYVADLVERRVPELAAFGLQVDDVSVGGFPHHFDIRLTNPSWDGDTLEWQAPAARAVASSIWPINLTGALAENQRVSWRGAEWRISGAELPYALRSDPNLSLIGANLSGGDLQLDGPLGPGRLTDMNVALSLLDQPDARRLIMGFDALQLATLPAPVREFRLDAVLTFNRAPGLLSQARITAIDFRDIHAMLGAHPLDARGTLTRGADGQMNGDLSVTIGDWRGLLAQLQAQGLLPADPAPMVMMMAERLAEGDSLTLPLTVAGSVLQLGPLALLDLRAP